MTNADSSLKFNYEAQGLRAKSSGESAPHYRTGSDSDRTQLDQEQKQINQCAPSFLEFADYIHRYVVLERSCLSAVAIAPGL
jgi:hypothetical protein